MKQFLLSLAIAITTLVGVTVYYQTSSPAQAKDCSANAVITCGVWSENDLKRAYNNDDPDGTKDIFNGMGINSRAINNSRIEDGVSTRDGKVIVDGQTVATGASSAGRQSIYGSSQRSHGDTTYYETSNQKAFLSEELDVFVMFDDEDMYVGAVIKDCGNPIKANPKTKPKPKPEPEPEVNEIQVCRLKDKKYPVTIREDQFDPKKHSTDPEDCKEEPKQNPSAACKVLNVTVADRTKVALSATASAKDGATISAYAFSIASSTTSQTIFSQTVESTSTTASTETTIENAGNYKAKVIVKTSEGDKTAVDCEESFKIAAPETPGVSIDKKVDNADYQQVEVGEEFTYQIRVTNTDETDLQNVAVTDEAPVGVTLIQASHGSISSNKWSYTIPELKVGKYADFTITAKVAEYISGNLVNTACVDAPSVPGSPDDCDDATVSVPKPEEMVVCRLKDKKYPVTIQKDEFDASLHSTDPNDCQEAPTVSELPQTGIADTIFSSLGLGALVSSSLAYVASRRNSLIG